MQQLSKQQVHDLLEEGKLYLTGLGIVKPDWKRAAKCFDQCSSRAFGRVRRISQLMDFAVNRTSSMFFRHTQTLPFMRDILEEGLLVTFLSFRRNDNVMPLFNRCNILVSRIYDPPLSPRDEDWHLLSTLVKAIVAWWDKNCDPTKISIPLWKYEEACDLVTCWVNLFLEWNRHNSRYSNDGKSDQPDQANFDRLRLEMDKVSVIAHQMCESPIRSLQSRALSAVMLRDTTTTTTLARHDNVLAQALSLLRGDYPFFVQTDDGPERIWLEEKLALQGHMEAAKEVWLRASEDVFTKDHPNGDFSKFERYLELGVPVSSLDPANTLVASKVFMLHTRYLDEKQWVSLSFSFSLQSLVVVASSSCCCHDSLRLTVYLSLPLPLSFLFLVSDIDLWHHRVLSTWIAHHSTLASQPPRQSHASRH